MNEAEGKIGEERSKGVSGRGVRGRQRGRERHKGKQADRRRFTANKSYSPTNSMQYHICYHVLKQLKNQPTN